MNLTDNQPVAVTHQTEEELVQLGKRIFASVSEPFSAVVHFMHQLPEGQTLPGDLANKILRQVFGDESKMPGLVLILSAYLKSVVRQGNVIHLSNLKQVAEPWKNYVVKKKELVQFEVEHLKDKLILKNVSGLNFAEFGMEGALQRCVINPPKLECTVKVGLLPMDRVVDIM